MTRPEEVRAALDRMDAGEASEEVLQLIVDGATAFASLVDEYVFRTPLTGGVFATQNDMLAETMQAAKPSERMLVRLAPPLPEWPTEQVVVCSECGSELGGDPLAWRLKHEGDNFHTAEPIHQIGDHDA